MPIDPDPDDEEEEEDDEEEGSLLEIVECGGRSRLCLREEESDECMNFHPTWVDRVLGPLDIPVEESD